MAIPAAAESPADLLAAVKKIDSDYNAARKLCAGRFGIVSKSRLLNTKENIQKLKELDDEKNRAEIDQMRRTAEMLQEKGAIRMLYDQDEVQKKGDRRTLLLSNSLVFIQKEKGKEKELRSDRDAKKDTYNQANDKISAKLNKPEYTKLVMAELVRDRKKEELAKAEKDRKSKGLFADRSLVRQKKQELADAEKSYRTVRAEVFKKENLNETDYKKQFQAIEQDHKQLLSDAYTRYEELVKAEANLKNYEEMVSANKKWNVPPVILGLSAYAKKCETDSSLAKTELGTVKELKKEFTKIHDERHSKERKATNVPPEIVEAHKAKRRVQRLGVICAIGGIAFGIASIFIPPLAIFSTSFCLGGFGCSGWLLGEKGWKNRWRASEYDIDITKEQVGKAAEIGGKMLVKMIIRAVTFGLTKGAEDLVKAGIRVAPKILGGASKMIEMVKKADDLKGLTEDIGKLTKEAVAKEESKSREPPLVVSTSSVQPSAVLQVTPPTVEVVSAKKGSENVAPSWVHGHGSTTTKEEKSSQLIQPPAHPHRPLANPLILSKHRGVVAEKPLESRPPATESKKEKGKTINGTDEENTNLKPF